MNYCEGCFGLDPVFLVLAEGACIYSRFNKYGECPCSTCLVKMMCNNLCEEFIIFKNKKDP